MNVLILGSGYVGNHLFNHLKRRCNVEQITQSMVNYTYTDKNKSSLDFKSYLHDKRFDIAVNCSGYTGYPNVDACEDNKGECWEYNVLAPVRTAETLNLFGIPVLHVSSGCIYQGSENWKETDVPNFGLYDHDSSFYSKSKHAGELALEGMLGYIFRIRMPFCDTTQHKNILIKYLKYNNIVSMGNSVTSAYDLCKAIEHFCIHRHQITHGKYNIVNGGKIYANRILEIMESYGLVNPNWNLVELKDLDIKAGRSNCTLSGKKLNKHFKMPHAEDSISECVKRLSKTWKNEKV